MQLPDTQQARDTNSIMLEVRVRFPEMPTFAYNRIFSAIYKHLEDGLTGDELASVVHSSLNSDKDLKAFWLNATRYEIQQFFRYGKRHAFVKSLKGIPASFRSPARLRST